MERNQPADRTEPQTIVSVITPVGPSWNAQHLAAARDSLASNNAEFEWIISCDRSDPAKVAAVATATGYSNVLVIGGLDDTGIAAARNAALELARGEWIYAFDADDYCLGAIDTLLQVAMDTGSVWAAGTTHDVDSEGHKIVYVPGPSLAPFDELIPINGFISVGDTTGQYPFLCSGATIIRTDIVRAAGGWNETLRDVGEDIALITAVSREHVGGWAGVEPVLLYRKHPASITASRVDEQREQLLLDIVRPHLRRE